MDRKFVQPRKQIETHQPNSNLITNSIGMKLVLIHSGQFDMGSTLNNAELALPNCRCQRRGF